MMHHCKSNENTRPGPQLSKATQQSSTPDALPLSITLCSLKEVASFEKKCEMKVNDLLERQKQLQEQIQVLEEREKDGVKKLREADCIWTCMEESYKKKIAETLERQKDLLKKLKEAESSNIKWRKNKKDLEFEFDNITKCYEEIKEKIHEKNGDLKCIDIEINNFKSRIESNKEDLDVSKKSLSTKKQASDARIANIAKEVTRLEKVLKDEQNYKNMKEKEGTNYVKEARNDLQKLCKVLLQKKLENEDLAAEREALLLEIDLLKQSCDQCKDKCRYKQESINDEIKELDKKIAEFKVKCMRCHECTDTIDIRKFCTDCPRCVNERDCLYENDQCSPDHAMDCVCTSVKRKFLDNVFDNMYTVLERQIQTGPGKAVAEVVLNCLKKSRNGKLNEETRKIIQDFILSTVKKNLNLTIVGGAVKTRCEMDSETYKQLMLCLKQVKVTKPEKIDKGTDSKKPPCGRWKSSSECNCPKGPNECICAKRAPPLVKDLNTCPPKKEDKEDAGQIMACPHKESTECGVDCAMRQPNSVGSEVASWRPDPCQEPTCQFKNMRAAQCVLGPDLLSMTPGSKIAEEQSTCKCGLSSTATCACHKDSKHLKAEIQKSCDKNTCTTLCPSSNNKFIDNLPKEQQKRACEFDQNLDEICTKNKDTKYASSNKSDLTLDNINVSNKIESRPDIEKSYKDCTKKNIFFLGKEQQNLNTPESVKKLDELCRKTEECSKYADFISDNINTEMKIESNADIDKPHKEFHRKHKRLVTKEQQDIHTSISDKKNNELSPKHKEYIKYATSENADLIWDNIAKKNKNSIEKPCNDYCRKHKRLSRISLTKFILDTKKEIGGICYKDRLIKKDQIYKVKVTGIESSIPETLFALKSIASDKLEVVLDKEFEEFHKKVIKEYEIDEFEEYANLIKTDSCHFVLDFDINKRTNLKKRSALISKTESGKIHLLIKKHKPDSVASTKASRKSSILKDLLSNLPFKKNEFHEEVSNTIRLPSIKSSSDSNLYEKAKFNIKNNQHLFIDPSVMLKKTSSGQYSLVFSKESKTSFINNVKDYLRNSSNGFDQIEVTNSGAMVVDVKTIKNNKDHHGTLKITLSGNIYVSLDEDSVKMLTKDTTVLDKVNSCSCKAVSTTCDDRCSENYCDRNSCFCNNICYKSNQWFFKTTDSKSLTANTCDVSDPDLFSVNDKMQNCYHVIQSICPHHNERESMIYKEYKTRIYKKEEVYKEHDLDVTIKNNVNYKWHSLEYLPPLLPHFLKNVMYK